MPQNELPTINRIDVHCHGFPEEFLRQYAAAYPEDVQLEKRRDSGALVGIWAKVPFPAWILEERLQAMERDGVSIEVLSAPTPVYARVDDKTIGFCRQMNEFQAGMFQKYPDRFRSFVHLPIHNLEATGAELERWKDSPSTAGIVLGSNTGGIYPGDSSLLPVWELIDKTGLPVFIHPLTPCGVESPIPLPVFHFPNDTAVAAATIIYSGLLDRFPDLKIILPHYGGSMPYHMMRLDMVKHAHYPKVQGHGLPRLPSEYVKRFYVDTAQGFHRPSFDCACGVFGKERILYGSDYFLLDTPWRAELNAFLDSVSLSDAEREAIFRGNAQRLLAGL